MAPPPPGGGAATARRLVSSSGRPSQAPGRAAPRRPPLEVVPARRGAGRKDQPRHRLVNFLSVAMVVCALLVVVVGHALLADGQIRMDAIQHQLTLEQSTHRQVELQVSQRETPPRIVGAALSSGMVRALPIEIPYVSTDAPLPAPHVTPAPAPAPSTTTTAPTS